jgi:hypothetical protein
MRTQRPRGERAGARALRLYGPVDSVGGGRRRACRGAIGRKIARQPLQVFAPVGEFCTGINDLEILFTLRYT